MRYRKIFSSSAILALPAGLLLTFSASAVLRTISILEGLLGSTLNKSFWSAGLQHAGAELILMSGCMFLFLLLYKKHPERAFIISSLAFVTAFLLYVIANTINIPINDDYYLLQFLNEYSGTRNISEAFNQLHESRLILMKLLAALLFHLNAFNFKILIAIGDLCLLGIGFLLLRSIQLERKNKAFLSLLLAILIFQFQYYDSTVWASGTLYNCCTLFFVFASICSLASGMRFGLYFAMAYAALAVMSSGAGFISLAIGLLILGSQQRIKESLIWTSISIGIFLLYFQNYSFGPNHYFHGFSSELSLHRIFHCILFGLAFLGGSLQFLYQLHLPILLGTCIWIVAIVATYKKYYRKNPAIYFLLIFILFTSLTPPLLRKNIELNEGISIRYGIYSILAVSCCVIFWVESINIQKIRTSLLVALPACLTFHLLTGIFFYPEVALRKEVLTTMMQNYKRTHVAAMPPGYDSWIPEDAEMLFSSCEQKNIYSSPVP